MIPQKNLARKGLKLKQDISRHHVALLIWHEYDTTMVLLIILPTLVFFLEPCTVSCWIDLPRPGYKYYSYIVCVSHGCSAPWLHVLGAYFTDMD